MAGTTEVTPWTYAHFPDSGQSGSPSVRYLAKIVNPSRTCIPRTPLAELPLVDLFLQRRELVVLLLDPDSLGFAFERFSLGLGGALFHPTIGGAKALADLHLFAFPLGGFGLRLGLGRIGLGLALAEEDVGQLFAGSFDRGDRGLRALLRGGLRDRRPLLRDGLPEQPIDLPR